MSSTATIRPASLPRSFNETAWQKFAAARSDAPWLAELRQSAFAKFQEMSAVPLDPEEWKRVETRAFRADQYQSPTCVAPTQRPAATDLQGQAEFAGHLVHVDGQAIQADLADKWRQKGVLFGPLSTLGFTHGDLLKKSLFSTPGALSDRFAAWHAAFITGGAVLYVPRNVEVNEPLHSLIALAGEGATDCSHTLVILEDGASATLLEETASVSSTTNGLHLGGVELILGAGSHLRYVQLQNWNEQVWHFSRHAGCVARDASLQWTVGGLGSRVAHIHQDMHLNDRGASAEVNGVTFATGRQVLSYYTQQWHHARDTRSDLLYKTVLRDRSRGIWRGLIKVGENAIHTDGYQRNDTLLMSDDARSDAIPGLEIETDDVRCTHGATAGRVDEEQLFYCMSRGMDRSEAMHLIVEGFFQRVFDRIPVEAVRETLRLAVQRKLGLSD